MHGDKSIVNKTEIANEFLLQTLVLNKGYHSMMTVNVFDNLDCNNENSLFIEPVVEEDLTNTVEMYTKKEMLILLIYNYGNCCNSHSCNNQTSHIYL